MEYATGSKGGRMAKLLRKTGISEGESRRMGIIRSAAVYLCTFAQNDTGQVLDTAKFSSMQKMNRNPKNWEMALEKAFKV